MFFYNWMKYLISLYLMQYKYVTTNFTNFVPSPWLAVMYRKNFVCLCRQTISRMFNVFNEVHAMSDMNNIYQFQDIWKIFTRVRARSDRQTNRMHKHFSTLLESVSKKNNNKTSSVDIVIDPKNYVCNLCKANEIYIQLTRSLFSKKWVF